LLLKFRLARSFSFLVGRSLPSNIYQNTYDSGFNTSYEERYNGHYGDQSYVAGVVGVAIGPEP